MCTTGRKSRTKTRRRLKRTYTQHLRGKGRRSVISSIDFLQGFAADIRYHGNRAHCHSGLLTTGLLARSFANCSRPIRTVHSIIRTDETKRSFYIYCVLFTGYAWMRAPGKCGKPINGIAAEAWRRRGTLGRACATAFRAKKDNGQPPQWCPRTPDMSSALFVDTSYFLFHFYLITRFSFCSLSKIYHPKRTKSCLKCLYDSGADNKMKNVFVFNYFCVQSTNVYR